MRLAAPGVGERGHEEQAPPGLAVGIGGRGGGHGWALAPRVGDLDPQGGGRQGEGEARGPAPHPAVQGRVRGQFGDEEGGRGGAGVVGGFRLRGPD